MAGAVAAAGLAEVVPGGVPVAAFALPAAGGIEGGAAEKAAAAAGSTAGTTGVARMAVGATFRGVGVVTLPWEAVVSTRPLTGVIPCSPDRSGACEAVDNWCSWEPPAATGVTSRGAPGASMDAANKGAAGGGRIGANPAGIGLPESTSAGCVLLEIMGSNPSAVLLLSTGPEVKLCLPVDGEMGCSAGIGAP
jgi:hypothetical protein